MHTELATRKVTPCDESQEYFFREGCRILELWNLELWNDPTDPDGSIARARVEPGKTARSHQLGKTVERYVILGGTGNFRSNKTSTLVGLDDVVVIPAPEPQAIENSGGSDLVFPAICTPRFREENYSDDTTDLIEPRAAT